MQNLTQGTDSGLCNSLCAGVALEQCEGCRPCWISKDLSELGEENHQERVDLIFVADDVIAKLVLQTHQFPIGRHLLAWHIAKASLITQECACNRGRIHPVCFGSQSSLLGKGMHLSWMQQAHPISSRKQRIIEIFPIARGGF